MSPSLSNRFEVVVALPTGEIERTAVPSSHRRIGIGRHETNEIRLQGDLVSRHHATVEILDDGLRVVDSSRNGTVVGEELLLGKSGDAPFGTPIRVGEAFIWVARGGFEPEPPVVPLILPTPPFLEVAERAESDGDTPAQASIPPPQETYRPAAGAAAAQWVALRRKIHRQLLDNLDLAAIDPAKLEDPSLRPRVLVALRRILSELAHEIPPRSITKS